MTASANTHRMLQWWAAAQVQLADLAVRRSNDAMVWHHSLTLDALHLGWARAENAHKADVYIRPARRRSWRLVLLDDVGLSMARRVVSKYMALAVQTSTEGGCHVWLGLTQSLDEAQRGQAQRWLAHRVGADLASISGEHLGRLAGFRNWKRDGQWVNVVAASINRPAWDPTPALRAPTRATSDTLSSQRSSTISSPDRPGRDHSPSGRDWACTCAALEAGADPSDLRGHLAARARTRRGRDANRYAAHTVRQAVLHVASKHANNHPPPPGT